MNIDVKKFKKNQEGFVLVITTFAVLLMATLIIAFLSITYIDLIMFKNRMCSAQAYYIAEAGIADAIDKIQQDTLTDTSWEENFPASPDKYSVVVTTGSPTIINSTGYAMSSNFSRSLEVSVNVNGSSSPYVVTINQWKEIIQ
jgi:Tfp pilus assembly protein PilX